MIALNKLSVNFTGDFLFKEISFVAGDKDRIGLVGKNGAGKSTLLKIIHRELEPESGTMTITAGFKTAYLPQELIADYQTSVLEEAMKAFGEQRCLEQQIRYINKALSELKEYETKRYLDLAQQLADATERFRSLGGHTMEGDAARVLIGLGFRTEDFHRPLQEFSNGWQMRVNLAKILLQNPEIILLDEPTNHLDIESIRWLEEYLENYSGCLILVSHDRAFLDRVTNRTIEITFGNIQDYKCNYSQYEQARLERMANQQNAYDNQQKQIVEIEHFIERFRYKATKAKQVQSRLKLLDKMDKVEVENIDRSAIHFQFPPAPHSGKITVQTENLQLGYDAHIVLDKVDFVLERGERIAFVGRNGEGKSTFVKSIVGELLPKNGEIGLGHQVIIGYYAQNQAVLLNPSKTVFETVDDIAVGDIRPKIRSILGSFLFSNEDMDKKVRVLSGGEKSRLALAKLLLSPFNLLILDEPTNHLDMSSKDVLKNALLQYKGSLIVVSHDRDFLQGLTEKVIEFKNGNIKTYLGDVYDFLDNLKMVEQGKAQMYDNQENINKCSSNKENWEKKKEEDAKLRKHQNRLKKLEMEIAELNKQLQKIEQQLADPEKCKQAFLSGVLYSQYEEIKKQIAEKEEIWIETQIL